LLLRPPDLGRDRDPGGKGIGGTLNSKRSAARNDDPAGVGLPSIL
jgi:hypothetical protein